MGRLGFLVIQEALKEVLLVIEKVLLCFTFFSIFYESFKRVSDH